MRIKNLHNALLQKDHFGQKNDFGQYSARQIFALKPNMRFRQKKIASYEIKLSTTLLFSDDFFGGLEGEGIEFLQRFCYAYLETFSR